MVTLHKNAYDPSKFEETISKIGISVSYEDTNINILIKC